MCFGRLMGEMSTHQSEHSSFLYTSKNHPLFAATCKSMNLSNRLLMSCILEFASSCFPEFETLSDEEKRTLAVKFFFTFRLIDNAYRASQQLVNFPNRTFGGFTLWLSEKVVDDYFNDFDEQTGDIDAATKLMTQCCRKRLVGRRIIERVNPDEAEFLAVITLIFWATNGLDSNEELIRISEMYQGQVLAELHAYYRSVTFCALKTMR
ncbi:hypothetical protein PMAYCL1PPCAC_17133, partial [Pristionchus mayeri]